MRDVIVERTELKRFMLLCTELRVCCEDILYPKNLKKFILSSVCLPFSTSVEWDSREKVPNKRDRPRCYLLHLGWILIRIHSSFL